jgi:hypothetical protein
MSGSTHVKSSRFPTTIAGPGDWVPTPAVRLSIWLHTFAALALIAYPEWWRWLPSLAAAYPCANRPQAR